MQTSGTVIAQLRVERGLTMTALAKAAGVTIAAVSLLESDQRRPSVDMARRLAKAMGASPVPIVFPELAEEFQEKK